METYKRDLLVMGKEKDSDQVFMLNNLTPIMKNNFHIFLQNRYFRLNKEVSKANLILVKKISEMLMKLINTRILSKKETSMAQHLITNTNYETKMSNCTSRYNQFKTDKR